MGKNLPSPLEFITPDNSFDQKKYNSFYTRKFYNEWISKLTPEDCKQIHEYQKKQYKKTGVGLPPVDKKEMIIWIISLIIGTGGMVLAAIKHMSSFVLAFYLIIYLYYAIVGIVHIIEGIENIKEKKRGR